MFGKPNTTIIVSLNGNVLKAAEVKGAGPSARIAMLALKDVSGISEVDLPKTIATALKGFKTKKANIYTIVATGSTTTKNIEIPSVNEEEIRSIVNLQAGRHTPFSREEIQIGYINIGVVKSNYTKVLLVIAKKDALKKQILTFEKAGLRVSQVLFAPESIAAAYANVKALKGKNVPVGIIDIDKNTTEFVIAVKGKAVTSRSIPVGKAQLKSEGDSAKENLIDELGKTLEAFQSEAIDQMPASYVLASDDAASKEMVGLCKEKLGWDVSIIAYTNVIKTPRGISKKLGQEWTDYSVLDTVAPGCLARPAQVNLIPEDLQMQKAVEEQGREAFKSAILGFLILVLVACIMGLKIYFMSNYLGRLTNEYKDNRSAVMSLEELSRKKNIIQSFMATRMESLDIINELYRYIPNDVYLTGIRLEDNGLVVIEGVSLTGSVVYNLNSTLKESGLFRSADVVSKTAKRDRGVDAHAFEINLKLKSAPEEKKADAVP